MTENFVTLAESKQKFKEGVSKGASFIATVVKEGKLNAGTGQNGDWTNKKFTLDDGESQEDIIAWNDDIKKLQVGHRYEFHSPYWTDYKGTPQLGLGNYCQLVDLGTEPAVGQKRVDDSPEPEGETLPKTTTILQDFVEGETILILQIKNEVEKTMEHFGADTSKISINEVTLNIYHESKKVLFKKGSNE